jgi:DNA-binding response OmpR family regulator
VPVIMLSVKDTEVDKAVGLGLGADDYVTKPFTWRELAAWIQAMRHSPGLIRAHLSGSGADSVSGVMRGGG